jgi:hypothetical protein
MPFAQNGTTKIELLASIALTSEGNSDRDLKNLTQKAVVNAVKRSVKGDGQTPVTLKESDFSLT